MGSEAGRDPPFGEGWFGRVSVVHQVPAKGARADRAQDDLDDRTRGQDRCHTPLRSG